MVLKILFSCFILFLQGLSIGDISNGCFVQLKTKELIPKYGFLIESTNNQIMIKNDSGKYEIYSTESVVDIRKSDPTKSVFFQVGVVINWGHGYALPEFGFRIKRYGFSIEFDPIISSTYFFSFINSYLFVNRRNFELALNLHVNAGSTRDYSAGAISSENIEIFTYYKTYTQNLLVGTSISAIFYGVFIDLGFGSFIYNSRTGFGSINNKVIFRLGYILRFNK